MNRKQWTFELLHSELITICAGLGHFPSRSELESLKRGDIGNALCRHGGYKEWSKRCGYERRHSDSDTGWEGEAELIRLLSSKGFRCQKSKGIRWPFDLIVNESVRVDVKTARKANYGICSGWFYRLGKYVQADIVALYRSDRDDCFLIPWYVCPATNITISESRSTYAAFLNNFELLIELSKTRSLESERFHSLLTPLHKKTVNRGSKQF